MGMGIYESLFLFIIRVFYIIFYCCLLLGMGGSINLFTSDMIEFLCYILIGSTVVYMVLEKHHYSL